ncbi:MAG: AAA family ATPase [bacterium]
MAVLRLGKVELVGFKSFARESAIDFERPVTAIVGPNGSGKSNILDAVLFAFGEQSPTRLRTGRMDDLIFGGAGEAKRQNFTSVKLTFVPHFQPGLTFRKRGGLFGDPGESLPSGNGKEFGNGNGGNGRFHVDGPVTLERRLYRDGVSEYVLNGETVRMKDVDEFFGRFGLGRGSVISINQGEVEKKILANPQEMRMWLVSACGIGMLIDQKRRTEEKLSETSKNLARLADLVSGVRDRVTALESEMRDANAYTDLTARLSALRTESLRRELAECFEELEKNNATAGEIRDRMNALAGDAKKAEVEADAAEEAVEAARAKVEACVDALHAAERAAGDAAAEAGRIDVEAKMLSDRIASIEADSELLAREIASGEARAAALSESADAAEAKLAKLSKALEEAALALNAAQETLTAERAKFETAQGARIEAERHAVELRNRLEAAKGAKERIDASIERRRRERSATESSLSEVRGKRAEYERERETASANAEEAGKRAAEAVEKLSAARENYSETQKERDGVRDALSGVEARLASLQALENEAEGFAPGKRALLTDAELRNAVGGVRDLWHGLAFPDEIAGAVYLVLSGFEDAVEVGNLAAGCETLAKFHREGIGKARLIETVRDETVPPRPDWWPDGVRRFYDFVTAGNGRLARMYRETGEVAIVETLSEANQILGMEMRIAKAVLADGSVMVGRGEAVGGAPSSGSRVLSRRKAIEELAGEAARLKVDWAAVEGAVEGAQSAVDAVLAEMEAAERDRARWLRELAVVEEKLSGLSARERELSLTLETITLELSEAEREAGNISAEVVKRDDEYAAASDELDRIAAEYEACAASLKAAENSALIARDDFARASEERRAAGITLEHSREQAKEIASRISDAKARLDAAAERKSELEARAVKLGVQREDALAKLGSLEGTRKTAEDSLAEARSALDVARARSEDARERAKAAAENAERFERDFGKFEVARGRLLYRYHDLWKRWEEETGTRRAPDADEPVDETAGLPPELLAIVDEALLLSHAWAESEGIAIWGKKTVSVPKGDEGGGYADEADYSEVELCEDGEVRFREKITFDAPDCGDGEPCSAGDDADDGGENPAQMEIADAPEILISQWEERGIPRPPKPAASADALEKLGRGKLRDAISDIELEIRKLGNVNLLAPEHWRVESQRLAFFLSQQNDLQSALEKLRALLADLDRRTLEKYQRRSARIAQRFNEYFVFLFGGGSVELKFTEPEDVLASGVEVMVTLPGERRQALRALSGGERSLVFLALFLAAHSMGESGFCIMDEVDAALDDANILRLGRLIDHIAGGTQFILVTHNKRTMELADALVGVVGRPKGVSTIIPVDLAKAQKYAEKA